MTYQMAFVGWALLLFFAQLNSLATSSVHAYDAFTHHSAHYLCHQDQANDLLKLKRSFFFNSSSTTLASWQSGTDCCLWEGIGCHNSSGHVIALNLSGFGLYNHGIDPVLFNLTSLRLLDLSMNDFGPIPHEVGALKGLTSLKLVHSGLSGRIPSSIVNLTRLIQLDLSGNYLSGAIPTSLFTLPALQDLNFSWNRLSGTINEFDAVSSHLMLVDLSMNELTGQIPESFFVLTSLKELVIGGNNLMGSVDLTSFWRLENLTYLDLSNNELTVTDGGGSPSSVYLPKLSRLELANCRITEVPNILTRLKNIAYLDLSCNRITGVIPEWIWDGWKNSITHLNLSYNMFTDMQLTSYVIPLKNYLDTLDLSYNRLQGQIPMPSSSAEFLDYSNNTFSSILPNFTLYLSDILYLSLSNNNISGYLPSSICDSPLEILDLSFNNFRGLIPPCLMENRVLNVLSLNENQFEGALQSNISSGCSLQIIDLHGNKIDGQLPRALSNCTDLEVLDLGRNQIADTFPSWLGRLLNLRFLVLRSNYFHGSIGYLNDEHSGEHFSSLQIIDLASNNFSGNLDPHLFESLKSMEKYNNTEQIIGHRNLTARFYQDAVRISHKGFSYIFGRISTTFTSIDLSDNALQGSIPESIGRLASVISLNMSHNAFSGEIPRQLGGMAALESMDLSSNQLSGKIPEDLTNLTFLNFLNLSSNQLEGRIPQGRQFTTFDSSSFNGNAKLCGLPLSKQCGNLDTSESHPRSSSGFNLDKERTPLIMSVFFCLFSLAWALELDFQQRIW